MGEAILSSQLTWAQLHSEIQQMKDVTKRQKKRIAFGWNALESAFGSKWLYEAISAKHPWIVSFEDKDPWVKSFYGIIGERINDLAGIDGLDIVIDKLKSSQDPVSAQAELNAGWKLFKSGIDFRYVQRTQKKKTADIKAKIDRKEIAIEVTVLRISPSYFQQMNIMRKISIALTDKRVISGGKVYRNLSVPHSEHIIDRIHDAISLSLMKNQRIEIRVRDVAEFCIAPNKFRSEVDLWKTERKMSPKNSLMSHDFTGNEGRRIHRIIQKKSKQIGDNTPGIVYIEGFVFQLLSSGVMGSQHFKPSEIEEGVYENKNLLFVVLNNLSYSTGKLPLPLARKASFQSHAYIARRNIAPFLSESTWLIQNRFHKWQPLRHKKLLRAFWHRGRTDPMRTWEKRAFDVIKSQFDNLESN